MVFTRNWGKREWELLVNGHRVFLGGDEKVLEMDSGDGFTS